MYLVTGSAGFIGFHTCLRLLQNNFKVLGIDNLNNYYDIKLKKKRNKLLNKYKNFSFIKTDILDKNKIKEIFNKNKFKIVIHLAAQAGVRYSIQFPEKYIDVNIKGFFNIIDNCKKKKIKHFIYASTSSVYGFNRNYPLKEDFSACHPTQIYAATKRSNELIAHSYSSLFNLPTTGLRFFTVYGPWGRPDMALFKFTKSILNGRKIDVYNNGNHLRDFTYIDDVVDAICVAAKKIPKNNKKWDKKYPNPKCSYAPYRIFNVGGNNPINLKKFISIIENYLGKKSKKNYLLIQKGDVIKTQSSISWSKKVLKQFPKVKAEIGIKNFIDWYISYYKPLVKK
jgi:UDP-glucuronate 4-epimerase